MAKKTLTTEQGILVTNTQKTLTVGRNGPILLQEVHMIEKQEMTL